jgi:hypothetical protein
VSGQPGVTPSDLVDGILFMVVRIGISVIAGMTERWSGPGAEQR